MDWLLIGLGWTFCAVTSFLMFERAVKGDFGKFTRADALFFALMACAGPISVFWALILTAMCADSRRDSWWSKPFR